MNKSREWRRIDAALDEILALPSVEWSDACARIAGGDLAFQREVESLLAQVEGEDPVLDFPVGRWAALTGSGEAATEGARPPPPGLPAGTRIGAFRVIQLLGRGGMGEVYRAERADGHFEQQVAIKLMRPEIADRAQRFHAERQILARLEHPNIAGLHDGGMADDGRLFMVMDLVEGQPITQWCRTHRCSLTHRLRLFLSVCDAVAYAHRKLIVHRDLKPGNVFVTEDGDVKLLDFGVARLLGTAPRDETRHAAMTPGYAAPEQLTGGQITTATDVYALGILLFELVTGVNPWGSDELPLAALVGRVLDEAVPQAGKCAAQQPDPPVSPKLLAGDLDAIIEKAMRKEPESRYESVAQLQADVIRTLRSEPVSARDGARWYVAGRFLRRHRWGVATSAVLVLAVLGAAAGVAWQGHVAKLEAARASAVKNFLVKVFRASDPRIAADKPRGQITAKELLDGSVGRIDQEFADQPELRLELLGMTSEIYGYLGDDERYEALMKRRVSLARSLYGEHHPLVIDGEITDAWASIYTQDFADANRHLQRADTLLREAGLDESKSRAEWWLAKERALQSTPGTAAARRDALDRGISLFEKYDPHSPSYPAALANAATMRYRDAAYRESVDLNERAIRVEESLADRDDTDLAVIYGNLGDALAFLGRFDEAKRAYIRSADLVLRTEGEHFGTYWRTLASHALMLYLHGDRDPAVTMFATMLSAIPADWKANTDDTLAREAYAEFLTRDGRAAEAVPILETALKILSVRPRHDYDLRHVRLLLGDAYAGAGRPDEARAALAAALRDYETNEPASHPDVLDARERWARLILEHPRGSGDLAAARTALRLVLADGAPVAPYSAVLARSHADLARLAMLAGQTTAAKQELDAAAGALRQVKAVYDVRINDELSAARHTLDSMSGSGPEPGYISRVH